MFRKVKFMVFVVFVLILSSTVIHGEGIDTGWKGYGLYNLNKSQVSISYETDTVAINGRNVSAVYEYTIKCNSDKSITVNFGYPDNGINKFSVHDGSKYLNYKTRNTEYLKTNYGVDNLQVPDGRWYLINMAFSPGQTRTIKVAIEAEIKKEESDTYTLSFFKDRNYLYSIPSEKVSFTLNFDNFKPYNIFDIEGIDFKRLSSDGTINITYNNDYEKGFSLGYQPIDEVISDKLNSSGYKKPKAIVKAIKQNKYEEALTLCTEYLNAPSDSNLNIEQVKFMQAECKRLLGNNQEYINEVEKLDINILYPERIKYKILIDRIAAYNFIGNHEGMEGILKDLIPEAQEKYPYINHWLNQKGYKLKETEEESVDIVTHTDITSDSASNKGFDILGALIGFFVSVRDSCWTYVIIGFLFGFIIGRLSKRKKKSKSVYLFRD